MPNAIFGKVVVAGKFSGVVRSDQHPRVLFDAKSDTRPGPLSERYGQGDGVVYIPQCLKGGVVHARELHLVRELVEGTAIVCGFTVSGLDADSPRGRVFVPKQRFSDYLSETGPDSHLESLVSIGDQLFFKARRDPHDDLLRALVVYLPGKKKLTHLGEVHKRLSELPSESVFRGLVVAVLATKVAVVWSVRLGHVAVPWTAVDSRDVVNVGDWLRFAVEANHWDREENSCNWTGTLAEKASSPNSISVSFEKSVGITVEGVGMVTSVPKDGVGYLWNDILGRLAFLRSNLRQTTAMPTVRALAAFRAVSAYGMARTAADSSVLTPWLVVEARPSPQRLPPASVVNCSEARFLTITEGGGLRFRSSSNGLIFADPHTDIWNKLGSLESQRQLLSSGQSVSMLVVPAGKSGLVPSEDFKWRAVFLAPTALLNWSPWPSQRSVSEGSSFQETPSPELPAVCGTGDCSRESWEVDLEQELESASEEGQCVSLPSAVMAAVLGDGELFRRFSSHHPDLLRKMVSQWKH